MREAPSSDDFRHAMGSFPTGVTIVTAADGESARAMTANSMTSVSLEPPSVLVCVNRARGLYGLIKSSQAFCVHILRSNQEALARACSQTGSPETMLKGVPYRAGKTGAPIIDGALGYIECKVAATLDFGTHTIYVGEVVEVTAAEGEPLLFYRGRYIHLRSDG